MTALDYLYAHDQSGARVLWLSDYPPTDNTPEMPWQFQDMEKIQFIAEAAPVIPGT